MNTQQERIQGYWFSEANQLPHGDNRVVEAGATHSVEGRIVICRNGLHFSQSPLDALRYAPGNILWGIEVWGDLILEKDKGVGRFRTYLWRLDASELLREFARACALDVIHLWDAPDIVMEYLKTGDETLRQAASYTANSAAYAVVSARSAARAAATRQAAAWAADYAASSAASYGRHAARHAAWAADAAYAVGAKQSLRLLAMIEEVRSMYSC